MKRRAFLAGIGGTATLSLSGCVSQLMNSQQSRAPPLVENRPDAVYYPTHVEGMKMAGMKMAGDFSVGLSYSFPHRFWTTTGTTTEKVSIREQDTVHLMASLWDKETKTILPVEAGLSLTVKKDGKKVDEKPPWPMLSQNMGFHYGDNYALDGNGTYTVTVNFGSVSLRRLGAFADKFDGSASTEIEFEFSQSALNDITFQRLTDRQGTKGAVGLMDMEMMPVSKAPTKGSLPGRTVGEGTSGDAVFVANAVENSSFVDGEGTYFAVSPRTPYNRVPLPMMTLDATVERDGSAQFDDALDAAIHPDLGYHYGATVGDLQSGDSVTVTPVAPPQVSRHEGYETAFVQMEDLSFTA